MAKKLEEIKEEECPYELPEGWKWERLGNEIVLVSGQDVPSKECNEVGNGVPYVMGASNIENSKFSATRWIENPRVISLRNDILISVKGTVGKLYIQKEDVLNISRQIMAIRVKENIANKYMFNFLVHFNDNLKTSANGLIPGISRDVLLKTIIPLPPKETQQNIVDIIDSLFAKLDIAQEKVEQVLAESDNRRSAILHNAFRGKLTEKWREENGVSFDSWKKCKIGDIAKNIKEKYDPTKDEFLDIPYVGLEHIEKFSGIIGWSSAKEVKSTKTLFRKDDILYGKLRPYLDKHDIADFDGMCSTDILVYRCDNKSTTILLNYIMSTNGFIEYAVINSKGINLPRTSEKMISEYTFILPTLPEQQEIVRLLDKFLSAEDTVKTTCQNTLETIATMRKSILAKAFRGELCS